MKQIHKNQSRDSIWDKIDGIISIAASCRKPMLEKDNLIEVLQLIRGLVSFDAATLYLLDHEKDRLKETISIGGRVELLSFLTVGIGDGLSGWTAHRRKPVLLSERSSISSFRPDNGFATFLSLPLMAAENVIGVLNLGCTRPRAINDNEVKLLSLVADQMALSIEREHYRKQVASITGSLQQTRLQLRQASRGQRLEDHLNEVARLAARINNGINNALSVIVGNIQCLLCEKAPINQKTMSRLKRMESASMQVSTMNRKVLELYTQLLNGRVSSGEPDKIPSNQEAL